VAQLSDQLSSKEALVSMLEEQVRTAESDKDNLGKQNSKLLMSKNPQAKTQYLDQLRNNLNASKKEVIRLEEENKQLKKRDEMSEKRI